jgi:hypothetical protein
MPVRLALQCLCTVILLLETLSVPTSAEEVSAPSVSMPVTAKSVTPFAERALAAMKFWQTGDPVVVREDLKEAGARTLPPASPSLLEPDPLLQQQTRAAVASTPPPNIVASFDGIPATGFVPPDAVGAIGPEHFIQMVNTAFAIYSRDGRLLLGPTPINSLWRGFGGPCETENAGDPVARYDHLANRWLVSQFAIDGHFQCIAVSRGPDPIGDGWYLYAFPTVTSAGTPVTPDYPKIGLWPDGYYMGTQRGFPDSGLDVWVFERDKMLIGAPARQIQFSVAGHSLFLMPSDLDGALPPQGAPNIFARQIDGDQWGGPDRIELFAFSVNWSNPSASSFARVASLTVAPFNALLCGDTFDGNCIAQPGVTQKLETLPAWLMWRLQYRNFGTYESLVTNHTVNADGHNRAGIRWYEFRKIPGGAWSVFQQGTFSPDSTDRWMGSIALDDVGDMALGYSAGGADLFPGIRMAARRAADPPGTMTSEIILANGRGSQSGAARWGDYSSLSVDPVSPCTFWYTTLYYGATSQAGWQTRIIGVQMPSCNQQQ